MGKLYARDMAKGCRLASNALYGSLSADSPPKGLVPLLIRLSALRELPVASGGMLGYYDSTQFIFSKFH